MLSRTADHLYWMARYIERAENTARFIDVNLQMSLDAPITFSNQWEPVIAITGSSVAGSCRRMARQASRASASGAPCP